MVDKYAVLLARGERQHGEKSIDKGVRLGQFHPRGTLLPFAVSVDGGQQNFKASKLAGCSSLLNFTSREVMGNKGDWAPFCRNILEERVVDTISAPDSSSDVGGPTKRARMSGVCVCVTRVFLWRKQV